MTADPPGAVVPVIAVDGPGGVGKGTLCNALAERLDWHLLDSGALYRLVALKAAQAGSDPGDEPVVATLAAGLDIAFAVSEGEMRILLDGADVTDAIRAESVGQGASVVAALDGVRAALVDLQRGFRQPPGLVADGRDMGSVIFADAGLKIFLTASTEERARRRYKQLKDKGIDVSLPALSKDMAERDRRDAERSVSPLRACRDARILDTTDMAIEDVVSSALSWVAEVYPDAALN